MADVIELVNKATEKGTFSILDAAKGIGYPSDTVAVYTDIEAAYLIKHYNTQAADELDPEKVDEIDAKVKELTQRIKDSTYTFHLRGYAPEVVRAINEEARAKFDVESTDNGDAAEWCNYKYVAEAIQLVTRADGAEDHTHWTPEKTKELAFSLPDGEFDRITSKMSELVFTAAYFDQVVDADF